MKVIAAAAVASALAFLTGVVAGPLERRATAATIVQDLVKLTALSNTAQTQVKGITFFNAPVKGPDVVRSFTLVITGINGALLDLTPPAEPFTPEESADVADAFTNFVAGHVGFLDALLEKQPMFSLISLDAPVVAALDQDQAAIDELAFGMFPRLEEADTERATVQVEGLNAAIKRDVGEFDRVPGGH